MNRLKNMWYRFRLDQRGQGTVEWVLITALIVVVVFGLIMLFRDPITSLIKKATDTVSGWS